MDPRLARTIGAFAVFFSLALPLFAALVGAAAYAPLVNLISHLEAPAGSALAEFFFNHFKVALAAPIAVGVAGATLSFLAWRKPEEDGSVTLARLLVIQTLCAFAGLLWLAALLLAVVKG